VQCANIGDTVVHNSKRCCSQKQRKASLATHAGHPKRSSMLTMSSFNLLRANLNRCIGGSSAGRLLVPLKAQ